MFLIFSKKTFVSFVYDNSFYTNGCRILSIYIFIYMVGVFQVELQCWIDKSRFYSFTIRDNELMQYEEFSSTCDEF